MAFFIGLLRTFLILITIVISKKSLNWREKFTAFECGYDFFTFSRIPFSINFFLIAIIFIIFDVEVALIVPFIPTIYKRIIYLWTISSFTFFLILIIGILLEWKERTFEWKL